LPSIEGIPCRLLDRGCRYTRACVRDRGRSLRRSRPRGQAIESRHRSAAGDERSADRLDTGRMIPQLDESGQDLLRDLVPTVLCALVRGYRDFGGCEDAVQEALLAAAMRWPVQGMPDNPKGWLITVATRRLTDQVRSDTARRLREQLVVSLIPADEQIARAADEAGVNERDETLDLYFMCCHPALSPASQIALTLRAVGGLTTAEIERAFLETEATMAQRLTRAKSTIRTAGAVFPDLTAADRAARLPLVLKVLYLVFSEGYTASGGKDVYRVDLSSEAIRVTWLLADLLPD